VRHCPDPNQKVDTIPRTPQIQFGHLLHQLEGEQIVLCIAAFKCLINPQRYGEAAQHILDALVLQDSDDLQKSEDNRGVTPNVLWDSLKACCLHMQRVDLAVMCENQNLEGSFSLLGRDSMVQSVLTN